MIVTRMESSRTFIYFDDGDEEENVQGNLTLNDHTAAFGTGAYHNGADENLSFFFQVEKIQ